jgi:hypothetical protein
MLIWTFPPIVINSMWPKNKKACQLLRHCYYLHYQNNQLLRNLCIYQQNGTRIDCTKSILKTVVFLRKHTFYDLIYIRNYFYFGTNYILYMKPQLSVHSLHYFINHSYSHRYQKYYELYHLKMF